MIQATIVATQDCGTRSYDSLVQGWIVRHFGGVKHAAKKLATLGNVSVRTAENWVSLRTTPRGDDLIALCVECDELTEALMTEVLRRRAAKRG